MRGLIRWVVAGMSLAGGGTMGVAATTPARPPLAVESNESTPAQLAHARAQGQAVQRAWEWERGQLGAAAQERVAGPFQIALTLTPAEGWYEPAGPGELAWREPPAGTAHLRVVVRDGADGRVVPELSVFATVAGAPESELPFGWYPLLNGYGANLALPTGGADVRVRLRIAPPQFHRHDPYNGDRFARETIAEFLSVPRPAEGKTLSEQEESRTDLAQGQGGTIAATLQAMWEQATSGAAKPLGDYRVAYAVEFAEAYWRFEQGRLNYRSEIEASAAKNSHVEVAPLDALSGRFLPGLHVTATVIDAQGEAVATQEEPLMWHPWLYHYGENWRVPGSGEHYRIRARADVPPWRRYGRQTGRRFAQPIEIEFSDVKMESGQK